MGLKSPEEQLNDFLVAQPSWLRKILLDDYSLTWDEHSAWNQSDWWKTGGQEVDEEYVRLLRLVPAKWREYQKRKKRLTLMAVPHGKAGRPRSDAIAREADELHRAGQSYAKARITLNRKYGLDFSSEAVRHMIRSRRCPKTPAKIQD